MPDGSKLTRVGATFHLRSSHPLWGSRDFLKTATTPKALWMAVWGKKVGQKCPHSRCRAHFENHHHVKSARHLNMLKSHPDILKARDPTLMTPERWGIVSTRQGPTIRPGVYLRCYLGRQTPSGRILHRCRLPCPQDYQSTLGRFIDQCARAWMGVDAEVTTDGEMKMRFPILTG